ncbi:MAG: orotidine 5'-phosphate decarboxylase [Thelocarpon superellum]|nr:MAG: orotidine 5'-phosphate decarboxylase [Thelocarpon superellum]
MARLNGNAIVAQPFSTRALLPGTHPLARYLLQLMTVKETNLCVSADVTSTAQLIRLAEEVGDSICMLKTHADMVDDWGSTTIERLQEIATRKKFLLFEDRKFGDIGSTVQRQYAAGPLRIVEWASLTNAHVFPGPAIVSALQASADSFHKSSNHSVTTEISAEDTLDEHGEETGERTHRVGSIVSTTTIEMRFEPTTPRAKLLAAGSMGDALVELGEPPMERGLLLLAEMSSKGNLLTEEYTAQCVSMAREHRGFVVGFVAQRSLNSDDDDHFLTLTPGVSLPAAGGDGPVPTGDGLGQQYNSPRHVVLQKGSDVIIVGRGIITARDRAAEAERYRREAWLAYEERVG